MGRPASRDRAVRTARPLTTQRPARSVRRALVSVYDKTGLEELARGLHEAGVAHRLDRLDGRRASRRLGVPVTQVEELTGFPECLDGRVKTLHPRVHAGILADTAQPRPRRASSPSSASSRFDLVVVNLYPFRETVASGAGPDEVHRADRHRRARRWCGPRPRTTRASPSSPTPRHTPPSSAAVAGGGFTLGRAASGSRRRRSCTPPTTTSRSPPGWATSTPTPPTAPASRRGRARRASGRRSCATARTRTSRPPSTRRLARPGRRLGGAAARQGDVLQQLRRRRRRRARRPRPRRPADRRDHQARQPLRHRGRRRPSSEAYAAAHACDPVSAFGGIIAANRPVTVAMAEQVERDVFTEVIVAPAFDADALEVLRAKKNLRLLALPADWRRTATPSRRGRSAAGCSCRSRDRSTPSSRATTRRRRPVALALVAGEAADEATLADLAFAWRAVRAVKSNAILLARDGGVRRHRHGSGQPGRLLPPRRVSARRGRPRARVRWRRPTRSSRSPTGCRCCSTPASARSSRPVGRCATRRSSSRGRGSRRDDVLHRHPPLRPLGTAPTDPLPLSGALDGPAEAGRCPPPVGGLASQKCGRCQVGRGRGSRWARPSRGRRWPRPGRRRRGPGGRPTPTRTPPGRRSPTR